MAEFYHVTTEANLPAILEQGLKPTIGPRSAETGEPEAAIFLFANLVDTENAVQNWLGEMFSDEENLVLLRVNVDAFPGDVMWEWVYYDNIPADKLTIDTSLKL